MAGRAWYFGAVELSLTVESPSHFDHEDLLAHVSGIMDTLGGSAGQTFTYLPIVYQDDCQVCGITSEWHENSQERYEVKLLFK